MSECEALAETSCTSKEQGQPHNDIFFLSSWIIHSWNELYHFTLQVCNTALDWVLLFTNEKFLCGTPCSLLTLCMLRSKSSSSPPDENLLARGTAKGNRISSGICSPLTCLALAIGSWFFFLCDVVIVASMIFCHLCSLRIDLSSMGADHIYSGWLLCGLLPFLNGKRAMKNSTLSILETWKSPLANSVLRWIWYKFFSLLETNSLSYLTG